MTDDGPYDISTLALEDDRYHVVQSVFRNAYRATDDDGDIVIRGKQKLFRMREEFPFVRADGEPAFTVKAGGILDVAGSYALIDEGTGEPVVSLERKWTLFVDRWKIRDPRDESLLAEIASKSTLVALLRHAPVVGGLFQLLPHRYEITDVDGDHVGSIDGEFSLRDRYTVTIDDATDVPREAVIASAMVIDAIEGN
ncbi:MAG: LURP-one-related/scramblase family protein [Halodesulfurarchaeum sp.]